MEVGVPGTNPPDAVFAHEDCGMGVMEDVARQVRKLGKNLSSHLTVPRGRDQHIQPRRVKQGRHKLPRLLHAPGLSHDPRMSGHSQEFVQDRPGRVPSLRPAALALEPCASCGMEGRIGVGSIDQDVGVDDNQCLPAFHCLVQRVPIRNIDQSTAAVENRQGG